MHNVLAAYIEERVKFHLKEMKQQSNLRALRAKIALAEYDKEGKDSARSAWWAYCEQSGESHLPTFREFWNDEFTYLSVV